MEIPKTSSAATDRVIEHGAPLSGTALVHPGVLRISGSDATDFLNRMSTNDLTKLKMGDFLTTVLTTEKGRMIDVIRVLSLDDGLVVLTSEGSAVAVRHWLEKYIIMENIQITSDTVHHFALSLFGDAIRPALSAAGLGESLPASDSSMLVLRSEGDTIVAFRDELWAGNVVTLFAAGTPARLDALRSEIMRTTSVISPEMLDACMIGEGVPSPAAEISLEYNPLECNFWRFVSFSKGCYIGQEVIARIDSYQKLQKRMTGFQFEPGATPGAAPGTVYAGESPVGTTTRHALSPRGDGWIAIGFLKIGAESSNLSFASSQSPGRLIVHAVTLPWSMS